MHDEEEQRARRQRYTVRQVTDYQASWTEGEPGDEGQFTLQLILDKGVDEHIIDVAAEDLDVLLSLFKRSDHVMFDAKRHVLMFENLDAD